MGVTYVHCDFPRLNLLRLKPTISLRSRAELWMGNCAYADPNGPPNNTSRSPSNRLSVEIFMVAKV